MQQWHLIYTKPQKEALVDRQLADRDLETFYPVLQIDRGYGRGIRREPFFPHYLFVFADLDSEVATDLCWMPGVRSVVYFADKPAEVPAALISELRQRLEPYKEKVLVKDEWLYKPGQKVIVNSGPFEGCEAIFQAGGNAQKRVQVLLNVLGAQTRTELDVDLLTPCPA